MEKNIILIKRKWYSADTHPYINDTIRKNIYDDEKEYGFKDGVYYDGTDLFEPYEEKEIADIMSNEPKEILVSILNPYVYKNAPVVTYMAYPIDSAYNSVLISIDLETYNNMIDDYEKNSPEFLNEKFIKSNSKEVHEQSLDELLQNDKRIWFADVKPNTLKDINISKGDFKSLRVLQKGKLNKLMNMHIFKINYDDIKVKEITDTDFKKEVFELAEADGYDAILKNTTLYLLKNFDKSKIEKFNYKNEVLNAYKNDVEISKNVLDNHPELSYYLTKNQDYKIPEFQNYKEVVVWMKELYPNIKLDMEHVDINIIKETINQLHILGQQFPDAINQITYLGTFVGNKKKRYNFGNRFAHATRATGELGLNPDHYELSPEVFQEKADKSVETAFHPRGSNNYGFVITHEFGHFVEWALRSKEDTSKVIEQFIYTDNEPDDKLSKYSLIDILEGKERVPTFDGTSEWFAEAFASNYYTPDEYKHELAIKTMDFLSDIYSNN